MTVIETDRLRLCRLTEADAPFVLELLNQPSFLRYIGDRGVRTVEDARRYVREGPMRSYDAHGFGLYRVERKPDGAPVGLCGLLRRPSLDDADLGYALLPAHWSKGYAYEAARAVLDHARDGLALRRVAAVVAPDNAASIRLLVRLGMACERTVRLPGDAADVHLYATTL